MDIVEQNKGIQRRLGPYYKGKVDGDLGPASFAAMFNVAAGRDLGPAAKLFGDQAAKSLPDAGITSPLRLAHWFAHAAHETGGFRWMRELGSGDKNGDGYDDYLIYLDTRTDLGNTPEIDGDGERYRGRGIPHLTGHDNYDRAGKALGLDLLGDPDQAAQPAIAVRIGVWFWTRANLNVAADRDDLKATTVGINGGYNGLADRKARLTFLKKVFVG